MKSRSALAWTCLGLAAFAGCSNPSMVPVLQPEGGLALLSEGVTMQSYRGETLGVGFQYREANDFFALPS